MLKTVAGLALMGIVGAALVWHQGIGRHRISIDFAAPDATPTSFLASLRAVYQKDNREFSEVVFEGIVLANRPRIIDLAPRSVGAFKRLEVSALHPAFRHFEGAYTQNPHWFGQRLPTLAPEPWTVAATYQPLPADEIENHFRRARHDWLSAVGDTRGGHEIWSSRDVLQSLVPRASFNDERLRAVPPDERRERMQRLIADQQYLMKLMREPGTSPISVER